MPINFNTRAASNSALIVAFLIFNAWLNITSAQEVIAPYCGDGICNGDETICSCSDCGTPPTPSCSVTFTPSIGIAGYPLLIQGSSQNDADGIIQSACTGTMGEGTVPASGSRIITTHHDSQTCTFTVINVCGVQASCSASITAYPLTAQEIPQQPYEPAGIVAPERATLTVKKIGNGSGTILGNGIYCNNCLENSATYFVGTQAGTGAYPANGSVFTGWSGDCSGTSPNCSLTMDSDKIAVANFALSSSAKSLKIGDVIKTTSNTNVPKTPGLSGSIVGVAVKGASGTIIDGPISADGYKWWKINYSNGIIGWSAENWLEPITFSSVLQSFSVNKKVSAASRLNVRSSPELGFNLIGTVETGTQGIIIEGPVAGSGFTWWKVEYDTGITGWSVEKWLSKYSAPSDPTPSPTPPPTDETTGGSYTPLASYPLPPLNVPLGQQTSVPAYFTFSGNADGLLKRDLVKDYSYNISRLSGGSSLTGDTTLEVTLPAGVTVVSASGDIPSYITGQPVIHTPWPTPIIQGQTVTWNLPASVAAAISNSSGGATITFRIPSTVPYGLVKARLVVTQVGKPTQVSILEQAIIPSNAGDTVTTVGGDSADYVSNINYFNFSTETKGTLLPNKTYTYQLSRSSGFPALKGPATAVLALPSVLTLGPVPTTIYWPAPQISGNILTWTLPNGISAIGSETTLKVPATLQSGTAPAIVETILTLTPSSGGQQVSRVNQVVVPATTGDTSTIMYSPTTSGTSSEQGLAVGDRVITADKLNVRSSPNGTKIGDQPAGTLGTIIGGSVLSGGYTWWQIDYDSGADGWSADKWLNVVQ